VYFARHALLSHRYALDAAPSCSGQQQLRMFCSRIVLGTHTGSQRSLAARSVLPAPEEKASTRTPCSDLPTTEGKASMRMPPLDPEAAKGEHFHSLVDCAARPKIYVITDNTRAYPGLRECTRLHVLASPTTLARRFARVHALARVRIPDNTRAQVCESARACTPDTASLRVPNHVRGAPFSFPGTSSTCRLASCSRPASTLYDYGP